MASDRVAGVAALRAVSHECFSSCSLMCGGEPEISTCYGFVLDIGHSKQPGIKPPCSVHSNKEGGIR